MKRVTFWTMFLCLPYFWWRQLMRCFFILVVFSISCHNKGSTGWKRTCALARCPDILQQLEHSCATASRPNPVSNENSPQIPQTHIKKRLDPLHSASVCIFSESRRRETYHDWPIGHYHHSKILAQNYLDVHPSWLIRHLKYQHGEILRAIPGIYISIYIYRYAKFWIGIYRHKHIRTCI